MNINDHQLRGAQCGACGEKLIPRRIGRCPSCWEPDSLEEMAFDGSGDIYSYTKVHRAPAGFSAPYIVCQVDLAQGSRVFGHMDLGPDEVPHVGMRVIAVSDEESNGGQRYVFRALRDI